MDKVKGHQEFDCCVVGGGMVGAAMALGLAKQGLSIALIEHKPLQAFNKEQAPDMRMSAFNMHSVNLLRSLGAWQHVLNMRYRPYSALSVWDAQHPLASSIQAKTRFSANELGKELLGYFVENRIVQLALYKEIQTHYNDKISCFFDMPIIEIDTQGGLLHFGDNQSLSTSLILGSDGANSQVRQAAGIVCSGWQYSQYANAILIKTTETVADETWQAFYESGPRALLPMHDNYATLVWYDNKTRSDWIKQADYTQIKKAVIEYFPKLASDFEVLNVAGFPLSRMHTNKYGADKAIILGDAAHTINPLAGQGVNLGYKDVSALLDIIGKLGIHDPQSICKAYERKRYHQNLLMMSTMDVLYKSFSSTLGPMRLLRGLGLSFADKAGPLKIQTLKYAMGLY